MTILTVDVAIVVGGRALALLRRNKYPFAGKLVFPGGHVEEGDEDTKAAASRELFEETGLVIPPERLELLGILDRRGRDPRYDLSVSIVYRVDMSDPDITDKIRLSGEASELLLVPLNKLNADLFGFDHYEAAKKIKQEK